MRVIQLFDQTSSTYTYLLIATGTKNAVLIDSVFEQHQRDLSLINELGLTLVACLDTHCHADHVTGAWLIAGRPRRCRRGRSSDVCLLLAAGQYPGASLVAAAATAGTGSPPNRRLRNKFSIFARHS